MAVVPPNNLPPDSQPWARDRDAAIEQLQFDVRKAAQDNDNAFTAVNNSLTAISGQIATIAAQQATIASVQASQSAQLAALNAQQVQITSILNSLVAIGSVGTSASGFSASSSATDYATTTITVPAGYTQAIVHCTVDGTILASTGVGEIHVQAVIGGSPGGEAINTGMSNGYSSTSASAIRSFSGLSGGTISVATRIRGLGTLNAGGSLANTNAIAVFIK